MLSDLLQKLEAALLRRNPALAPMLRPPLTPDDISKKLKRAGIKANFDPIIALYSWHNGANAPGVKSAQQLGFTPPTISDPPAANIEYLRSLGHKIDPNLKIYGSFIFFDLDAAISNITKLWKKFAPTQPRYAALYRRAIPFLYFTSTGQQLALDTDTAANGRIISIQPEAMKSAPAFTLAYHSFADFLQDALRANESNQLLTWPQNLGSHIELQIPGPTPPRPSAKKKRTLPLTENILALRTDFSNDPAYESLRASLTNTSPIDDPTPILDFITDPTFANTTPKQLPKLLPENSTHPFAVIIDQTTLTHPDHPLLIVDLQESPGRSFRTTPAAFQGVYNNLSLANMDFSDFSSSLDKDKVFRGFP